MTLSEMASAIRNHVVDGLNGASATAFSKAQLRDEIIQTTSTVIMEYSAQGVLDASKLSQKIDGIRVECKDVSANCAVKAEKSAPHFTIPNLNRGVANPILFMGSPDGELSFKVYMDREYRYHKHRLSTKSKPFAWVSSVANAAGLFDVFLFNTGKYNALQFISIDAIFDNPYDILKTDYYEQFSGTEYYAPTVVQARVIDLLTQKYVNYYRQLNTPIKPNTQQA